MDPASLLTGATGFQWDAANAAKNWKKHRVTQAECEQLFFNVPFVVAFDAPHLGLEKRFIGLGRTEADRPLMVVFTMRRSLIRVISARPMSRNERKVYANAQAQENS